MFRCCILLIFATPFLLSCQKDRKDSVNFVYDREVVPMMHTDSVTMLISDSGIIRYKVITKTWDAYEQAKDPHWFFPHGLYLEQFDTTLSIVATVKADSVWNYTRKKLWKLKGNVFIKNSQDETFSGEELFWDENKQKVYSNQNVVVNRPGRLLLRGTGFEANQQMTEYRFFKATNSDIYVKEENETGLTKTEDKKE